jgi:exonuclease SbcC
VRLNALRLVNFRQHADSSLEFELGLTGIIGPNGAGKSTILEAIAWALYGNSAARGTRESIRYTRAQPRSSVRVELEFELAGHRYRVVRGLTSAEVFLDGAPEAIANSITGANELLQRRLGMTRAEFFNTYFTGQKELSVMAAMGAAERGQFLSRVLGYERLRAAQELVRTRRREIAAEIAGLRTGMPDPAAVAALIAETGQRLRAARAKADETASTRAAREEELAAITPRWQHAQAERDRVQEILAQRRVAEAQETALGRDLERIERELASLGEARVELERLADALVPISSIAEEFRRQEELAREEGRRSTLDDARRALADELALLGERRARVDGAPAQEEEAVVSLERQRRELEESMGQLEARRTEWVRDRQEAETKRDALRRQYAELREQRDRIVDLGEEGTCPTCARPLRENFRSVLEQFDEQIETIAVDGKFYSTRLEQLEQMPDDVRQLDERRRTVQQEVGALERRLAKVQLAVQELAQLQRDIVQKTLRLQTIERELAAIPAGYDALRHAELRRETERLAPLNDRATRLSAQIDREPSLSAERDGVRGQLDALHTTLVELRAGSDDVAFSETEFVTLRARYEEAAAAARASAVAAAAAQADADGALAAQGAAARQGAELERTQAALDALQRDRRLHDELDRAYNDLRTDLNFQLRPELSELASAFHAELTDQRYSELELDDQYNVLVHEDGVPKPVISGGEEDMANLVLRLAISQMIAERAGQAFSLLILDEVFGSLDEARRHNVVELLRRLEDRFEQVILITHIESVREGLDRVITVRYDEDAGAAVVSLPDGGLVTGLETPSSLVLEQAG